MEEKKDMGDVARETMEAEKARREQVEALQKRLSTPIPVDEARRQLAGLDYEEAKLSLLRAQALGQLNLIDQRLEEVRCARAEIGMRLTVPAKDEPGSVEDNAEAAE